MVPATLAPLPDSARLWLFVLDRPLEGDALDAFTQQLGASLATWRHKGVDYQAALECHHARVVLVAEPTMASSPSGCAIEGMSRKVAKAAEAHGAGLVSGEDVVVLGSQGLQVLPRVDLPAFLAGGELTTETPVLDWTLFSVGDLRQRGLFRPAAETWLGRKFGLAVLPA